MEERNANQIGRNALAAWQQAAQRNIYVIDKDLQHSIAFYLANDLARLTPELTAYGEKVVKELEPLVIENNLAANLPRLDTYDSIGNRIDKVVHHPSYAQSGDIIYSSKMLERMSTPGGLLEGAAFLFLSSQTGEAGHHCPIACSAGMLRVFKKIGDFPHKDFYLQKLQQPSYHDNFTAAQFLTEIQGGSDVGKIAALAYQDNDKHWRIKGEKWFCSNANAELIFIVARFNPEIAGTRGLGLFLLPSHLASGERNTYTVRRLKDKLGTRSMASAEMDFHDTFAIAMGPVENGFPMVMENVLHISRLLNTVCLLGMGRRAYYVAKFYAQHREAFDHPILSYPLVKENLARIKAENTALLAGIFATLQMQDQLDQNSAASEEQKLLLRLLANLNKTIPALWTVDHLHHAIDVLAGNGAIESFSTLPRLFRDSIVCENWEGTHNTLRMQILRDIDKYQIDEVYLDYIANELSKIASDDDLRGKRLVIHFERTQFAFAELKKLPLELKTLRMPKLVTDMMSLFCAVSLLREAMHQTKSTGSHAKSACLDYFLLLHLNDKPLEQNQAYLDLVTAVVTDIE